MSPLCQLLSEARDPISEVARRWDHTSEREESIGWDQFRRDVAGLRERLLQEPQGGWLLLTEDAYAFAVGLLALWHSGRYAILPPNRQSESLRSLQTRAGGVLCDRSDWLPDGSCLHPLADAVPGSPFEQMERLSPAHPALELYTSGTTGAEKPIMKRIGHLEEEILELESLWGRRVAGAVFFSTALPQHLYGLLFGVLWPLGAGHSFQTRHLLHAEEAVPRMRAAGRCVLASVPTHLKRFARHGALADLAQACREVFSSGGPLGEDTAHSIQRVLGRAPVEVLGSTETGGIAWRTQDLKAGPSLWTPFPSVQVTCIPETHAMKVHSPFVSVGSGEAGFVMGDRISTGPDGRFSLDGRIDRVVKVGEKRLDLFKMESQLRAHPLIEDLSLLVIEREGIMRVAAAVVPSDEGWTLLEREGRGSFSRQIRSKLAEEWDPVLHPRYWRFLRELPENTQGKRTSEALSRLFGQPDRARVSLDGPIVLEEFRALDELEYSCQVPMELSCLLDHVLDGEVVPGVTQLEWALQMLGTLQGRIARVDTIESLRFHAPLRPGQRFRINVRLGGQQKLYLRLWGEEGEFAKGRILLRAEEANGESLP